MGRTGDIGPNRKSRKHPKSDSKRIRSGPGFSKKSDKPPLFSKSQPVKRQKTSVERCAERLLAKLNRESEQRKLEEQKRMEEERLRKEEEEKARQAFNSKLKEQMDDMESISPIIRVKAAIKIVDMLEESGKDISTHDIERIICETAKYSDSYEARDLAIGYVISKHDARKDINDQESRSHSADIHDLKDIADQAKNESVRKKAIVALERMMDEERFSQDIWFMHRIAEHGSTQEIKAKAQLVLDAMLDKAFSSNDREKLMGIYHVVKTEELKNRILEFVLPGATLTNYISLSSNKEDEAKRLIEKAGTMIRAAIEAKDSEKLKAFINGTLPLDCAERVVEFFIAQKNSEFLESLAKSISMSEERKHLVELVPRITSYLAYRRDSAALKRIYSESYYDKVKDAAISGLEAMAFDFVTDNDVETVKLIAMKGKTEKALNTVVSHFISKRNNDILIEIALNADSEYAKDLAVSCLTIRDANLVRGVIFTGKPYAYVPTTTMKAIFKHLALKHEYLLLREIAESRSIISDRDRKEAIAALASIADYLALTRDADTLKYVLKNDVPDEAKSKVRAALVSMIDYLTARRDTSSLRVIVEDPYQPEEMRTRAAEQLESLAEYYLMRMNYKDNKQAWEDIHACCAKLPKGAHISSMITAMRINERISKKLGL